MKKLIQVLATTTALTAAFPAVAQDAPADAASREGDIIVTARRADERLQEVPVSVQAFAGDTLEKLAITDARDITKLAPGLNIQTLPNGGSPVMVLRGIRWTDQSGTPAIPTYVNEAPFGPTNVLMTMYDIGQIEVLRGPQGTSRGAPSIPGAVTITTRKPNLDEFGGYIFGQWGSHNHKTLQAALNIPIVADKLALRIAGSYDDSEANLVRSIHNPTEPVFRNKSVRASLRFEPSDTFELNLSYQYTTLKAVTFTQVAGSGATGAQFDPDTPLGPAPAIANPFVRPGYNIAPLTSISFKDRLSVEESPNRRTIRFHRVTANAQWEVAGHNLTYILGYQPNNNPPDFGTTDAGNSVVGFERQQVVSYKGKSYALTNELRLASIRDENLIDYDIGVFYYKSRSGFNFNTYTYLAGAFGQPLGFPGLPTYLSPANPVVTNPAVVSRYTLPINLDIVLKERNYSFYGNVEVHLPADIELTAGVRIVNDTRPFSTVGTAGPGFSGVAHPGLLDPRAAGAPCAAFGLSDNPIYPGFCESPVPLLPNINDVYKKKFHPVLYNVSLSRKFSDNVLVYGTVGSSYRTGVPNTGTFVNDPALSASRPEYATSFELGVKSTLLDGKLRFNVDVFQINYKDQITQFLNIPYFNVSTNSTSTTGQFLSNIRSRVRGIEVDLGGQVTDRLSFEANLSYAKIKSRGGLVPCDIGTPGPVGDGLSVTKQMNFCPSDSGAGLNASSPFQASMTGNYVLPLGSFDGYFRFIVSHQGRNPNFGISDVAAKAHTLVDLFAGLSGNDAGWEVGAYAKNVFNKQVLLSSQTLNPDGGVAEFFGPTGLSRVRQTQPREIGVTLRYAFGSR
jgi:iron complex outermembrane receptor protein